VDELVRRLRWSRTSTSRSRTSLLGTKKKVEFVAAVLHRPRVLLLDEPFEAIESTLRPRTDGVHA